MHTHLVEHPISGPCQVLAAGTSIVFVLRRDMQRAGHCSAPQRRSGHSSLAPSEPCIHATTPKGLCTVLACTTLTHRRPNPLQPRVRDAPWMPVCSVLAVASYNFAYAQLPLHISKHVHPRLYATLQQAQAQHTALGLHGSPSARLALPHLQCGWLAGNLPLKHSQRCSKFNAVESYLNYAVEIWWCVCTCTSAQQGV